MKNLRLSLLSMAVALTLGACGSQESTAPAAATDSVAASTAPAAAAQVIQLDGSSTVYPITEAVAEEFQKAKRGAVRVTVGVSGTGGGFKKFCRGETDISNASRPILKKEMDDCRAAGIGAQ